MSQPLIFGDVFTLKFDEIYICTVNLSPTPYYPHTHTQQEPPSLPLPRNGSSTSTSSTRCTDLIFVPRSCVVTRCHLHINPGVHVPRFKGSPRNSLGSGIAPGFPSCSSEHGRGYLSRFAQLNISTHNLERWGDNA